MSGHYSLEPQRMEARFPESSGLGFLDSIFSDPDEDDQTQIDHVRAVLDQLPPREADFVELYYFKHLKQTDIASIFNVSQPTVCYRLARAADRIRFLLNAPKISKADMECDLAGFLIEPLDVQIMIQMWETTCQSEVAKRLNVSQGLVRHRFLRSLSRMRENVKLVQYVVLFDYISANLNILREVQRTAWSTQVFRCVA
jgi:DNA-directed RNA polymerase specialized sigma24 family protein